MTAKDIIQNLNLRAHPEGGYYAETYRSEETITTANGAKRNVCTGIYFLLENEDKSHFHKIKSDELWFFHLGQPLEIVVMNEEGVETLMLGSDLGTGERLQAIIPANTWFAARLRDGKGFALVSCTVAPGFDFEDFELGERRQLLEEFPSNRKLIEEFT